MRLCVCHAIFGRVLVHRVLAIIVALHVSTGLSGLSPAAAKPPAEAYSEMADIRSAAISPDGKHVAFLQRFEDLDYVLVYNFETGKTTPLANADGVRARYVTFAGNDYVIAVASNMARHVYFRGKWESSAAFAINLKTKKMVQLLSKTDGIWPAQGGLGQMIGVAPDGDYAYMPVYVGEAGRSAEPTRDVLKVNLETGRGTKIIGMKGRSSTKGWLVDRNGAPLVREDFNDKTEGHEIFIREPGGWRRLRDEPKDSAQTSVYGISLDGKSIIATLDDGAESLALYAISTADGSISGPVFQKDGMDAESLVIDANRIVYGVQYSGMTPTYQMFDPQLDRHIRAAQLVFPKSSVSITSWTSDWSKVLLFVEGGDIAGQYYVFDRTAMGMDLVASARPAFRPEDIGEVMTIAYKSRDGLTIPSVITWPTGVPADQRKNLPMVMMPHGGPGSYDAVSFDWLAQSLANEGYMVFQPNFRGSTGFGYSFRRAGNGEWGRKMQDDISDGVKAAVDMKWADPDRICIMGWSYGGYAALAGGALTPELYKCVVSVAGVADLRMLLATEKKEAGDRKWQWERIKEMIGDPNRDREGVDAVSPVKQAAKFDDPVLLIHGTEDLIVEVKQSDRMNEVLKAAGKDVTYLRIKGDDHSLVENESRRQTLGAVTEFLAKHIGATPAGAAAAVQ
jgi:dipeptidyl aminopeptidase/acylaminoacyl peptidase